MAESFFQKITNDPRQFADFVKDVEHDPSQLSRAFVNSDGSLAVPDKKDRDNFLFKLVDQNQHDYDAHSRDFLQKTRQADQHGWPKPVDNDPLPQFELSGALEHARKVELRVKGQSTPIYSDNEVAQVSGGKLEHFEEVRIAGTPIKLDKAPTVACSQPGRTYQGMQDCFPKF